MPSVSAEARMGAWFCQRILPMDSAHGFYQWILPMDSASGFCQWVLPMNSASGFRQWILPADSAHGFLPADSAHGFLPVDSARGFCQGTVDDKVANIQYSSLRAISLESTGTLHFTSPETIWMFHFTCTVSKRVLSPMRSCHPGLRS